MITLYELHWSHYCEKVRLALNYMGLDWRPVAIDPFQKREIRRHPLPKHLREYTVPAIHDSQSDTFVMDSTPILRHLAQSYPGAPPLFPGDAANRAAIDARLLELDCRLGLLARRFAYTQVILECPTLLPRLFLGHQRDGFFLRPGIRRVTGWCLAVLLMQRFAFHRSEALGLYEALESYLVGLATELENRAYVVGDAFSAADLALAALLRPLTIVPFFADHPRLATLFERHRQTLAQWAGEGDAEYQRAISEARTRRPPVRRRIRKVVATLPFAPREGFAENDQQDLWNWGIVAAPWHCVYSLRQNKVRARHASAQLR